VRRSLAKQKCLQKSFELHKYGTRIALKSTGYDKPKARTFHMTNIHEKVAKWILLISFLVTEKSEKQFQ